MKDGEIRTFETHPMEVGISEAGAQDIKGGEPEANARIIRDVLDGWKGACRDIAVLNAAAAILVGGKASDLKDGVARARDSLDNGSAKNALEKLIQVSNKGTGD
jgi:anthranilate phosphoribosyltransferase